MLKMAKSQVDNEVIDELTFASCENFLKVIDDITKKLLYELILHFGRQI